MILVPFFILFLCLDNPYTILCSLLVFVLAAITDILDGFLARRGSFVTDFGRFVDPLADKLLVLSAFISFVGLERLWVPAWLVVVIFAREFLISGLRLIAVQKGVVIKVSQTGKAKAFFQMAVACIILFLLTLDGFYGLPVVPLRITSFLLVLAVALTTFTSGVVYVIKYKGVLKD
jgi:CDP-diacylglycerol--glycerol-3-phosphate 3-phosphatidyltransferase